MIYEFDNVLLLASIKRSEKSTNNVSSLQWIPT